MKSSILIILLLSQIFCFSQNQVVIDQIIGMVGKNIILKSDLESARTQYISSGYPQKENLDCVLYEELLYQKMLLHQAELDSVEISEAQIQQELDRRISYFVSQLGSIEQLEKFYQKSITQIKNEFHDLIKDQLLTQNVQSKLTSGIKATPKDIKEVYENIPKDSLPYINSQVKLAQIVKKPKLSDFEKKLAKDRILDFRKRIMSGEDFSVIAVLYSEDEGSAARKGELGFMKRDALVAEFSSVAFKLIKGEVSEVVETEFGFHIIQLIEKRGEEANFRHILVRPKSTIEALVKAKESLDSLRPLIKDMSFDAAAEKYSDDKDTKFNGGIITNTQSGTSLFDYEQLGKIDPSLFFAVEKMNIGDISEPLLFQESDGTKSYRIVKLIEVKDAHVANLRDDYQLFQDMTMVENQKKAIHDWIKKQIVSTYINIIPDYKTCTFANNWLSH